MLKSNILLVLICLSLVSSQYNQDARMLGLSGAYTNIAEGFSCVGINPANLSYGSEYSMNLGSINASFWNNALSLSLINTLNNANMIDSTSINYYDKNRLKTLFDERGLVINSEFNLPLPVVNLSYKNWALTSSSHTYTEIGMPTLLLDFMFFGNIVNEKMNFELPLSIQSVQETGITYSNQFKSIHLGVTAKHILGYYYTDINMVDSAFFMTDTSAFEGKGGFLLKQGIGGSGFGLDIGILTEPFLDGYQVGMSITNILGDINWKQDSPFRELLEESVHNLFPEEMQLHSSEYYYYYFLMDSINAVSLSSSEFDDLFNSEGYSVIKVESLDHIEGLTFYDSITQTDVALSGHSQIVELSDSSGFLIPSEDISDKELDAFSNKPFTTRHPSIFRLGISRNFSNDMIVAMDLSTGFSSTLGSYDTWRINLGTEITRFKHFPIRFGVGFGGGRGASLSVGSGIWYGPIHFDIGFAYKKGLTINSSKGLGIGVSLSIQ